jgi:hypothetical protein
MSASTRNPNVSDTAARHLAKAMCKVHPAQRRELLRDLIRHAEAAISVIDTGHAPAGHWREPSFLDTARELLGLDLGVTA